MVCRRNEINREEANPLLRSCTIVFIPDPYPTFKGKPDINSRSCLGKKIANFFFFNDVSTGTLQQFELGFTVL
jgi:hypothetical protein